MSTFRPDGWRPVSAGELDRLEGRLRWRRWLRRATTAAAVTVVGLAVGLGTLQAVSVVRLWVAPAQSPSCAPCHTSAATEECPPK